MIFRVYNGWIGNGNIHRIVEAMTEEEAFEKVTNWANRGRTEDHKTWCDSLKREPCDVTVQAVEMARGVETEDFDG